VDDPIRDKLAAYLFEELADWQLILSFHDRAWFERFCSVANQKSFRFARRRIWRDINGGVCISNAYRSSTDYVANLVAIGEFQMVPAAASRLLEELAEGLSTAFRISVRRNEHDTYTLGDLWPGIETKLRSYSSIWAKIETLNESKYLRNLVGAHSTSWAEGFTDSEAQDFGRDVLAFANAVSCGKCRTTLRPSNSDLSCRCGQLQVTRGSTSGASN